MPKTLPFAPPGVEARVGPRFGDASRLLFQGSTPGLILKGPDSTELEWTIEVLISFPGADGSPGWVVSESQTRVDSISGRPTVVVGSPLSAGTYRVDFKFFDRNGASLGSYFEYVQVVPISLKPRLGLSRKSVSPGESLQLRVENLGTRTVDYGLPYELQRYEDGRWRPAPQTEKFFAPKMTLAAGHVGNCQGVPIFKGAKPGIYRIRKRIQYFLQRAIKGKVTVSETFFVRR